MFREMFQPNYKTKRRHIPHANVHFSENFKYYNKHSAVKGHIGYRLNRLKTSHLDLCSGGWACFTCSLLVTWWDVRLCSRFLDQYKASTRQIT
jgi:hypothetical protein